MNIDCWLALAQNHISPKAYKQNDIVKALNGTHIEVMHTDAEGRMVLADTLTLASRAKPNLMIDFATLTGSMAMALGARYSGVFGTSDELALRAVSMGKQTGERMCAFPQDEDYEAGAGFQSGRHQAMHAGRRSRPHSRHALPQALRRARHAVGACGPVGQPLRRRAGHRGAEVNGVRCGAGA